jgi:phenylacetate-CoA ligase
MQRLGIFRRRYIHVQDSIKDIYGKLVTLRASALHSYPSIMAPLARLNLAQGGKLRFRMAFSASEALPDGARKTITESFGCDLRNMYGTTETSWVAWECEKGSMHVHPSVIVEAVDERGARVKEGNEGNLLITTLWKQAMPLIRYRVGDRGSLGGRCGCGRGLQVLSSIMGREDDYIILPSGAGVSARAINLMDDVPGLREYQIVQERPELLVFRYCPVSGSLSDRWRQEITERMLKGCLGEAVAVEFEEADRMARGAGGKLRTVISKVQATR